MMTIVSNKKYRIKYQEDTDCNVGSRFTMNSTWHNPKYLEFYGHELIEVIIIMGMLPKELTIPHTMNRINELMFKIYMVQAALKETDDNGDSYLSMDSNSLDFMDSSEKGAISYWLGMFIATLVAVKEYGYMYVVHYSKFVNSKYSPYPPTKKGYIDPTTGKMVKLSSPDLIAMKNGSHGIKFGVFEAKGYQVFSKRTMEKALLQVRQINSLGGNPVSDKIVAYSRLTTSEIVLRTKDPVEGIFDIDFDDYIPFLWQFIPAVELFSEIKNNLKSQNRKLKNEDGYYMVPIDLIEGARKMKIHCGVFDAVFEYRNELPENKSDKHNWFYNNVSLMFKDNLPAILIE